MTAKTAVLLLCLMAAGSAISQEASQLPDRAAAVQASYKAAVARATAPLTKTYLAELERLKADYTKKGDLKSALAVDTEIKSHQSAETPGQGAMVSTSSARPASGRGEITPEWLNTITIARGTTIYWFELPNSVYSQKTEDEGKVPPKRYEYRILSPDSIEFSAERTGILTFTFEKNRKSAIYTSPESSSVCEVSKAKKK